MLPVPLLVLKYSVEEQNSEANVCLVPAARILAQISIRPTMSMLN